MKPLLHIAFPLLLNFAAFAQPTNSAPPIAPNGTNSLYTIDTVAGSGADEDQITGPATNAYLNGPYAVAVDASGNIFISDHENNVIRKVNSSGLIETIAGVGTNAIPAKGTNGVAGLGLGFSGDGGPATNAELRMPYGLAVDAAGNLFFADEYNHRVRRVDTNGVITTVAGNGDNTGGFAWDGGPATNASLVRPVALALDAPGNLYIADQDLMAVLKIDVSGIITRVAGNGQAGFSGDGGPATDARLDTPVGLAVDSAGNVYIADLYNYRVRAVGTNGLIKTIVGTGRHGLSGDGGPATAAEVGSLQGLAVDTAGDLFLADSENNDVRMVTPDGSITNIAGDGNLGYAGDGGPATLARMNQPYGVAVGPSGKLVVSEIGNGVVRELTPVSATVPQLGSSIGVVMTGVIVSFGGFWDAFPAPPPPFLAPLPPPPSLSASRGDGTSLRVQLSGLQSRTYILQAASSLAQPVNWRPVFTNTSNVNGNWSFTNASLSTESAVFYRAVVQ